MSDLTERFHCPRCKESVGVKRDHMGYGTIVSFIFRCEHCGQRNWEAECARTRELDGWTADERSTFRKLARREAKLNNSTDEQQKTEIKREIEKLYGELIGNYKEKANG